MHDSFYDSPEWLALRARVIARDGSKCLVGGLLGGPCRGVLHVHHIVPRAEAPELELDEENCGSACAAHHPMWEALRRGIIRSREVLPPCSHRHPYASGREACARRRAREAGLLEDVQLAVA